MLLFCICFGYFSKKHQRDMDTNLAPVYPPLLMTQSVCIHGLEEGGGPPTPHVTGRFLKS